MTGATDVFVAGAGPAGSVAAALLATRGLSVLLADRSTFPRDKVCGGCLGGLALRALDDAGLGDLPDRLGARRLDTVAITAGGRTARLALPTGRAVSRRALDHALLRSAEAAGASFLGGRPARLVSAGAGGVRVRVGDEEFRARVAIAADGLSGTFLADLPEFEPVVHPASRIGAGVVIRTNAPYPAGTVHLAAGPGGYVGMVRVEDDRLEVAACLDPDVVRRAGGPGPAVVRILARVGSGTIPGLADARFRGTPALTRHRPRVAADGVFVIGDATGYVEPFTGEGMGWALAAAVAVAPLAAREFRPELADLWKRTHRRLVRRRQLVCGAVAALLRRPSLTRVVVAWLRGSPAFAGPVLSRLNAPPQEVAA